MVVAASAARTVLVVMRMVMAMMVMIVFVLMRMTMGMSMALAMAVGMAMMIVMMMVMPVVVIADMGTALRLERALDGGRRAALPAHELGDRRVVLHVESVGRDLHQTMLAAEVPGKAGQAQGILGPDLEKRLGRRLHLNEPAVLEPQGIAVVDSGFHVEIDQDLGPALGSQGSLTAVACLVIEGDRIDDAVGLHGGLADDGGDAGHGLVSVNVG